MPPIHTRLSSPASSPDLQINSPSSSILRLWLLNPQPPGSRHHLPLFSPCGGSDSLPTTKHLREQRSRDFAGPGGLVQPGYEQEAVKPLGDRRQSAYISVLVSPRPKPTLCTPLQTSLLSRQTLLSNSCPAHDQQLEWLRTCHPPPPLLQTTSTSSSTTSTTRSANPAYANVAKDSTTSDKSAPPVETATLESSGRHALPFGQLQDLHVSFNQIATGPWQPTSLTGHSKSLDSARHLTTDVAAARYQGRLADQCLSVRLHRAIRDLWRREEAKPT